MKQIEIEMLMDMVKTKVLRMNDAISAMQLSGSPLVSLNAQDQALHDHIEDVRDALNRIGEAIELISAVQLAQLESVKNGDG